MDVNNQMYVPESGEKVNLESLLSDKFFWSAIEVSQKAIDFLRDYQFPVFDEKVGVAISSQELLESYILRSETYRKLDYSDEFSGAQRDIEFDEYDSNSVTLISKDGGSLCGTVRLIMDGEFGLACEKHFSLDGLRSNLGDRDVVEISRLIIDESKQKGSLFFKMFESIYKFGFVNNIDQFVFSVIDEHVSIYEKFGGIEVLGESLEYGNMPKRVSVLHWDTNRLKPKYMKRFNSSLVQ